MDRPRVRTGMMVTRLVTLLPDSDVFGAMRLLLKHLISGASVIDHCRDLWRCACDEGCDQLERTRIK